MSKNSQIGRAQVGSAQIGAGGTPGFHITPSAAHATGVVHITATFDGASSSGSNTFAVVSGPATAGAVANYVQVNSNTVTFDITLTAVSSTPVVISDSVTGTTQNFSAAAVVPGAPTIGTATDNHDGSVTVTFSAPADNGGATITGYTAAWTYGETASGSASPITIFGVANLLLGSATVRAINGADPDGGPESAASNTLTPDNFDVASIVKLAPFLDWDVLDTDEAAQAFEISGGVLVPNGAAITNIFTIAGVTNGRGAQVTITPNAGDGGFHGILRWDTGNGLYIADELNFAGPIDSGLSTRTVTKICNLPPGTDTSGTIGYQIRDGANSAVGSHVTTGIAPIYLIPGGFCADITLPVGGNHFIVWDNGAGVSAADEIYVPSPQSAGGGGGGGGQFDAEFD